MEIIFYIKEKNNANRGNLINIKDFKSQSRNITK